MLKLGLVDNQSIFLDGLEAVLKPPSFQVVARGSTADDALEIAAQSRPDILILDMSLLGDNFFIIETLRALSGDSKVVIMTVSNDLDAPIRALESGAFGYVLKSTTTDELKSALGIVSDGNTFISPSIACGVIKMLRAEAAEKTTAPSRLSRREDQIVQHLLLGGTNKEIAANLRLTEKTVKNYMTSVMQKLQVRNRVQLVLEAQKHGMGGQRRIEPPTASIAAE